VVAPPGDHKYVDPADAFKATVPPAQNVVDPPAVIVATGNGRTVTVVGADVVVHPKLFVIATVGDPEAVATMLDVVAPFDHK
jgi:hypothetical protein